MDMLPKDCAILSIHYRSWGNNKKADASLIETKASKEMMRFSKKLIQSPEFKAIGSHYNKVKKWISKKSIPTFFQESTFFVKVENIEIIENFIEASITELNDLVNELVSVYIVRIDEAEKSLANQFNRNDYPSIDELKGLFAIERSWISYEIAKNLPESVFKKEAARIQLIFKNAEQKLNDSLALSLQKLINHMVERLTENGEDKKKSFKVNSINNIMEFFEDFKNQNVYGFKGLEKLVAKAEKIIGQIDDVDKLRTDVTFKEDIRNQFTKVEKALDDLIVEKPKRKFKAEAYKNK